MAIIWTVSLRLFIILYLLYLTTLSLAHAKKRQTRGRLVNNKSERMWKEARRGLI